MKENNFMTKTKALKEMLENERAVIDPMFASKIAKAFGYSLRDLGLKAKPVKDFHRMNYTEETKNLKSIAVYELARMIAKRIYKKTFYESSGQTKEDAQKYREILGRIGFQTEMYNPLLLVKEQEQATWWEVHIRISSMMNGQGSYADDITRKSVEAIKAEMKTPITGNVKDLDANDQIKQSA